MYTFHLGLFDAKGLHHPVVAALQLGRAYPRHVCVGSAWHNGHEWVRGNLRLIVRLVMERQGVDLQRVFGLTPHCYDSDQGVELEKAGWEENFEPLGKLRHAFPQVSFDYPSWARDLDARQYTVVTCDGDLSMWKHGSERFGSGLAGINRLGPATVSNACSFHKLNKLEEVLNKMVRLVTIQRNQDPETWDTEHCAGYLLDKKANSSDFYQKHLGDYTDEVIQHDVPKVALAVWELLLEFLRLLGSGQYVVHFVLYNHPVTGRNGIWGRFMFIQEAAADEDGSVHPLARMEHGSWRIPVKGNVPSANGLEAGTNKRASLAVTVPTPLAAVVNKLAFTWTQVSRDTVGTVGYSVLPDYFGMNKSTTHRRKAGRYGKAPTSRDLPGLFRLGVMMARSHDFQLRFHRVKGHKETAEFIVASESCMAMVAALYDYDFPKATEGPTPKQRREYMKTLRTSWVKFLADPDAYIAALRNDASRWGVKEVRKHLLDRKFGLAPNKAWRATAFQLHQIVISDVLFLCGAFHRVVPRKHLTRAESKEHLFEKFRNGDRHDPWNTDVRYFTCLHCNQCSKTDYCEHIAAVTCHECILPAKPNKFLTGSVEAKVKKSFFLHEVTDRWAVKRRLTAAQAQSPSQEPPQEPPQKRSCPKKRPPKNRGK